MRHTLFEHVGGNQFKLSELNIDTYYGARQAGKLRGDKKGKNIESLADKRILASIRKYGIPMKMEDKSINVLFPPNFRILNAQINSTDSEQWSIPNVYIEFVENQAASSDHPIVFKKTPTSGIYSVYLSHVDPYHRIIMDRATANKVFQKIGSEFRKVDPTFKSPNSLFQG
jgi:hypothetical protein